MNGYVPSERYHERPASPTALAITYTPERGYHQEALPAQSVVSAAPSGLMHDNVSGIAVPDLPDLSTPVTPHISRRSVSAIVPVTPRGRSISAVRSVSSHNRVIKSTPPAQIDEALVAARAAKKSYKEIKQAHPEWHLEESTLRGRFRTLSKPKEQRLRKPVWTARAVSSNLFHD